MSSGFRGSNFAEWNIKQKAGKPIGGIDVDFDDAKDNFGGFVIA